MFTDHANQTDPLVSGHPDHAITRRDFMKMSAGTVAVLSFSPLMYGCGGGSTRVEMYPIDATVLKTSERMITFPYVAPVKPLGFGDWPHPDADPATSPNGGTALTWDRLRDVSAYERLGYGRWAYVDEPLPVVARIDIMPAAFDPASVAKSTRLANFFAMTDVHLTDKEAPNQLIDIQRGNPAFAGQNTSIYSGVMMYAPHVFDAAIQTANALHKQNPFDFFISLGDVCNSTMYNELRWYIDIIDGKVIHPSSGAHLGADKVDYQKPFKAAGLDKSIPFYQTLGNHDHFMIGSFPVYESNFQDSYVSDTVWSVPNELLTPNIATWPVLFDKNNITNTSLPQFYQGLIDGTSPDGAVIYSGAVENYASPPKIVADPDRRSLHRTEWMQAFFDTTTTPVGHGFNLVASNPNFQRVPESDRAGFACYSFVPKTDIPLKVIVLDNTQREDDGSVEIHGHGFLDEARWTWLQAELDDGQAANQLMIIAAHIPIGVANIGSDMEWWQGADVDPSTTTRNAVDLAGLVSKLQSSTNLLMWIAGHRHMNHVKAFVSPDLNQPEQGFWQVETSSLRDFPQQFRTFEIFLNSDYTVSIEAINVDPAIAEATPAAKSRRNAIAAQQIVHSNLTASPANYRTFAGKPIPPTDPSRPQSGEQTTGAGGVSDPTVQFVNLGVHGVPYNASYNARLFKHLSPAMRVQMERLFPAA